MKERIMNRSVLGLTTVLLMSALIIGGCGSNQDDHDTSLKVRTITIGEEAGTTSAGYSELLRIGQKRIWRSRLAAA